jgi:glycosyltransferase involved in cell wall biosynthesis
VRILVDYRPALRQRTGVGEYMHNLVRAYTRQPAAHGDEVTVFTSSWKDRASLDLSSDLGAQVIDRRVPVRVLNYLWHRCEWPPVEALATRADIVHAAHPLLIPSRAAAQVVTIHDLFFLTNRESTQAEIRRDYAEFAAIHARRAHAIVVNSKYTASLVHSTLGVAEQRIHVCSPGPPDWRELGRAPHVRTAGYLLFIGTLEARKNVGTLLDAYCRLLGRRRDVPALVLAGRATPDADAWLDRLSRPPLAGRARHVGYVTDKEAIYAGARMVIVPSLDEGFGMPVIEAMAASVPVIAADRGALPEVLGDAGLLVNATDAEGFAAAIERLLTDEAFAQRCAQSGLARARLFSWPCAAASLRRAYEAALDTRQRQARDRAPAIAGHVAHATRVAGATRHQTREARCPPERRC